MTIDIKNLMEVIAQKTNSASPTSPSYNLTGYLNVLERQGRGSLNSIDGIEGDPQWDKVELLINPEDPSGITDLSSRNRPLSVTGAVVSSTVQYDGKDTIYFDGNSEIKTNASTINLSNDSFILNFNYYPTLNNSTDQILFDFRTGASDQNLVVYINGITIYYRIGATDIGSFGTVTYNAWNGMTLARFGDTFYMKESDTLFNGGQQTNTTTFTARDIKFGRRAYDTAFPFTGYMTGLRVTLGSARNTWINNPSALVPGPFLYSGFPTIKEQEATLPYYLVQPTQKQLTYDNFTKKFYFRGTNGWRKGNTLDQVGSNAGFIYGGLNPDLAGTITQIQRYSFSSNSGGTTTDAGDLNTVRTHATGLVDYTNAACFVAGGTTDPVLSPTSPLSLSSIERHLGANTVTSSVYGDLTGKTIKITSASSYTDGYVHGSPESEPGFPKERIDKFSYASASNAAIAGGTYSGFPALWGITDFVNQRGLVGTAPGSQVRQYPFAANVPFTVSSWGTTSPGAVGRAGSLSNPVHGYIAANNDALKRMNISSTTPQAGVLSFDLTVIPGLPFNPTGTQQNSYQATAADDTYGWLAAIDGFAGESVTRFPFAAEVTATKWVTYLPAPTYTAIGSAGSHY